MLKDSEGFYIRLETISKNGMTELKVQSRVTNSLIKLIIIHRINWWMLLTHHQEMQIANNLINNS